MRPEILQLLNKTPEAVTGFIRLLTQKTYLTEGKLALALLEKDTDDNKVLACAEEGIVTHLVTGNTKDFPFKEYNGIKIVTPREFLDILEK